MRNRLTIHILCGALGLLSAGAWAFADRARPPGPDPTAGPAGAVPGPAAKPLRAKLIDINSASRAELKTLPGIGDAEAARIIKARPYPSKAKLLADKVLSAEQYTALKGRIVAGQRQPAKAKGRDSSGQPPGKS